MKYGSTAVCVIAAAVSLGLAGCVHQTAARTKLPCSGGDGAVHGVVVDGFWKRPLTGGQSVMLDDAGQCAVDIRDDGSFVIRNVVQGKHKVLLTIDPKNALSVRVRPGQTTQVTLYEPFVDMVPVCQKDGRCRDLMKGNRAAIQALSDHDQERELVARVSIALISLRPDFEGRWRACIGGASSQVMEALINPYIEITDSSGCLPPKRAGLTWLVTDRAITIGDSPIYVGGGGTQEPGPIGWSCYVGRVKGILQPTSCRASLFLA